MNQVPPKWYYYPLIALILGMFMWLAAFLVCAIEGANLSNINWLLADAQHYESIRNEGYQSHFLAAFFPLFPFLWRIIGLSAMAMGMVNAALYCSSAGLLGHAFKLPLRYFLLFCCLPLNVFFFLPYSESIFAFAMVLLLIGAFKNNWWLMITGVVICSYSRPTAALLIPALILGIVLVKESNSLKKKLFLLPLVAALSFIGVLFVQSLETGSLLTFFEAQESWGSHWRLPEFPLSTWGSGFNLLMDALSLFIALIAGIGFFSALIKKTQLSFVEWFSLAFIGGTGLLVVLTRGGELYSLSRFVYCIPVFPFAMAVLFKEKLVPKKGFLIVLFLFPWLFGIHVHIHAALSAIGAIGVLLLFTWLWKANTGPKSAVALAMLFALQVYCCSMFLQGLWLG